MQNVNGEVVVGRLALRGGRNIKKKGLLQVILLSYQIRLDCQISLKPRQQLSPTGLSFWCEPMLKGNVHSHSCDTSGLALKPCCRASTLHAHALHLRTLLTDSLQHAQQPPHRVFIRGFVSAHRSYITGGHGCFMGRLRWTLAHSLPLCC